jgi:hypothetical protein
MFTDTDAEFYIAFAAFFASITSSISFGPIGKSLINNRSAMQAVSLLYIVLGAYTAVNGVAHLDVVGEMWHFFTDNSDKAGEFAKHRRGGFALIFLVVWPILSLIAGLFTIWIFAHAYKDTPKWIYMRDKADVD